MLELLTLGKRFRLHWHVDQLLGQLLVGLAYWEETNQRVTVETGFNLFNWELVHVLGLEAFIIFNEVGPFGSVHDQRLVRGKFFGVDLEILLSFRVVQEEKFLNPDEQIVTQQLMLGPLALIVNPERALVTQVLFTVLTELSGVVLLALLANNFTIDRVLWRADSLALQMGRNKVLLKTRFAVNDLAFWAFDIDNIQLLALWMVLWVIRVKFFLCVWMVAILTLCLCHFVFKDNNIFKQSILQSIKRQLYYIS